MSADSKKTVLITGGAGFIGSNFVRYVMRHRPSYDVVVLDFLTYAGNLDNFPPTLRDDPRFSFWYGDVRNADLVRELVSRSDIVVHFAAESHVTRSIFDNREFFETDVMGTQVVANAVLRHRDRVERFVHISSSEVYGTAEVLPMDENHPLKPLSPYAAAKVGADRLVYSYCRTYDIPAVILRPFNNYGPNQHLEKVIPRFITSVILNEPLTIHGDGLSERDWVYVEDTCRAVDMALHCDLNKVKGKAINIGTGVATNVLTIANMVRQILGKPDVPISPIADRPGQVSSHCCDASLAKELLGWVPNMEFGEGLARTARWYEQNRKWWEPQLWLRKVPIVTADGTVVYH